MKQCDLVIGATASIAQPLGVGRWRTMIYPCQDSRAAVKTLKKRMAGIGADTSDSNTDPKLVEIVQLAGAGRCSR